MMGNVTRPLAIGGRAPGRIRECEARHVSASADDRGVAREDTSIRPDTPLKLQLTAPGRLGGRLGSPRARALRMPSRSASRDVAVPGLEERRMRLDRFPLRALALVATLAIAAASPLAAQGHGHAYGRVGKAVTQHRGDDGWRRDRDGDRRRWNRDRDDDHRRWNRDRDDRDRYRDSRATWDRDRRAAERRAVSSRSSCRCASASPNARACEGDAARAASG